MFNNVGPALGEAAISLLFWIIRYLFSYVQRLLWRITGISKRLDYISKNEIYDVSAHALKIIARFKPPGINPTFQHFITAHEEFLCPIYILRDNVSLMCFNQSGAVFVETSPIVDVYSSRTNPFSYNAQYEHAKRLIVLPFFAFHKLAAEVGDPVKKIVWMSGTGRCGSTLVSQIFENSEPNVITQVVNLCWYGEITLETHDKLLQSSVRLMCKSRSPTVDILFIKTDVVCAALIERISLMFPRIIQLFLYLSLIHI